MNHSRKTLFYKKYISNQITFYLINVINIADILIDTVINSGMQYNC